MIHPDIEKRKEQTERCRNLIKNCPGMGAPVVSLCTGTRHHDNAWQYHPANADRESWWDLIITLEQLLPVAEANNVILGIEPERANVVSSAPKARKLLDEMKSPSLKIILDAANLVKLSELDGTAQILEEAFDVVGDDLVHIHAKDVMADENKSHQPAGRGLLDFGVYCRLIVQCGFQGPVILHNLTEADVASSVQFVARHLHLAQGLTENNT